MAVVHQLFSMDVIVEGEWNNFTIRYVQLADIPKILEFIAEHGNDPIRDLAPVDETYNDYAFDRIAKLMESKEVCELSLIATDNITGDIAGIHMQFIWRKEDAFRGTTDNTEEKIPPFRKILNAMHAKLNDTKLGMFARYGVEFVVWNFCVAINSKHRNRGLASEMYSRVVLLLKSKKFPLAFSIFTSPFSRRAAQKEGFVEIDRVYFNELRNENDELMLASATGNDFASVMVLQM